MFDGGRCRILHPGLIDAHGSLLLQVKLTACLPFTKVTTASYLFYSLFYPLLRRVAIVLASKVAACSTSSLLDQRPSVKRSAPSARSREYPIAISTEEGSVLPSWQAEPVELATSGVAARTSSPATPSTLILSVLGNR